MLEDATFNYISGRKGVLPKSRGARVCDPQQGVEAKRVEKFDNFRKWNVAAAHRAALRAFGQHARKEALIVSAQKN